MQPVSAIVAALSQYQPQTIWLGFSGGLDSSVLLHALQQVRAERPFINIQAIHVHHGLSPLADHWAEHCQDQAEKLHILCHIEKLKAKPGQGESVEHWAREQRYACFRHYIQKDDILLTAHHQDDQAETVLLQLLRGAGPKGLSAMPELSRLGEGFHIRPFLSVSRQSLEDYAKRYQLPFIEDHSNQDVRFDRNFIRHQLMPVLKQRWPACAELLSRAAQNCAEQEQVLHEFMQAAFPVQAGAQVFPIDELSKHSQAKQHLLLRAWIHQISGETPSRQLLEIIRQNIIEASQDAEPFIKWGVWEFHRYRGNLHLIKELPAIPAHYSVKWDGADPLRVSTWPELLSKEYLADQGLEVDKLDWERVTVRLRQGGERCHPRGREHSQTLKKCLQEYHIPPWLRDRMPLIYCADKLVMAVGAFACETERQNRG